jgi:D-glycero-D-manno-heptose 1,7-bisphosphate phosphatase
VKLHGPDMSMHKAVFLDKDGTLIKNVAYNADPRRIKLCEGVPEALRLLGDKGFRFVIVSNQSGVAHGYFEEQALSAVSQAIRDMLAAHSVVLDGFYYCPHHPGGKISGYAVDCECRKPKPGMLLKAAAEMRIDLSRSWMIGDILHDVEAGSRAGCKTILIDNGNETEWVQGEYRTPTHTVKRVPDAAAIILAHEYQSK